MNQPPNLRNEVCCVHCKHHQYEPDADKLASICKKYQVRLRYQIYICDSFELNKNMKPGEPECEPTNAPDYQI